VDVGETPLEGGWQTAVSRRGDAVLRSAGPQSATVIELLKYLAGEGFDAAPRPIDSGFAPDGRERLSFVEGTSPHPSPWSHDALWDIGRRLAVLHHITSRFEFDRPNWRPWFARSLPGTAPVIGHGDLGPWNIIATNGRPVAFIDWDNAGPVDAVWELAQVVWLNANLHDDDVAELNELDPPAERVRHAAIILDGYGLPHSHREGFVDKMIEFAIRSARDEAISSRIGPESTSPSPNGFPLLWAVTWRTRSAAWLLDHRDTIQSTISVSYR
jgi:hypothetical protein